MVVSIVVSFGEEISDSRLCNRKEPFEASEPLQACNQLLITDVQDVLILSSVWV